MAETSASALRLADLLEKFRRVLVIGFEEIPPNYPQDRFIPSFTADRDVAAAIVTNVAILFPADAVRLRIALDRFYAVRDWPLLVPCPGDDEGWRDYQQRHVKPLRYRASVLAAVLAEVRDLVNESTQPVAKSGQGEENSDATLLPPSPSSPAKMSEWIRQARELVRGQEGCAIGNSGIGRTVREHFLRHLELVPGWPGVYQKFQPDKFQTIRELVAMMIHVGVAVQCGVEKVLTRQKRSGRQRGSGGRKTIHLRIG